MNLVFYRQMASDALDLVFRDVLGVKQWRIVKFTEPLSVPVAIKADLPVNRCVTGDNMGMAVSAGDRLFKDVCVVEPHKPLFLPSFDDFLRVA
jgi:hypothetical protein